MTRINCVPPNELARQHLIAEYYEIHDVFKHVLRYVSGGHTFDGIGRLPQDYVLGTGHIKFFYNKLGWVADRYDLLVAEMRHRGYRTDAACDIRARYASIDDPRWWGTWEPTPDAIYINQMRIDERRVIMGYERLYS